MIKILHVHGGMRIGGTESVIMNWYRNIDSKTYQFDFTSTYREPQDYDNEIITRGGSIVFVPSRQEVGILKHCVELYKAIALGSYDVVHSHDNFHGGIVSFIAKLAGVKKIITHSHSSGDSSEGIVKRIEKRILRILIKLFATDKVACTQVAGEYLYGKSIFSIINNGIDTSKFKPLPLGVINQIKIMHNLENKFIIGHIGRFTTEKNHDFIIQLIIDLKKTTDNFKVILIGDGPEKSRIEQIVVDKGLQDNIVLLGVRSDVEKWINVFDVLLLPSIYEGFPVVLVESQACGTPCFVSNTISSSVDLGLNLVKFFGINKQNIKEWSDNLLNHRIEKEVNAEHIKMMLSRQSFTIEEIILRLEKIYEL